MSDVEQNPSPDRHLYAGFMRQFDEARRTVAALDTVFRDGNVEAVKDAQRIIRQLADRVQELEGKSPPSSVQPEKERRPIAEHELRGQIESYAPQSEDKEIGFRDGWRSSERFHGISPSPSMVGREGDGK